MQLAQWMRRERPPETFVADTPQSVRGVVVAYSAAEPHNPHNHESVTRIGIARKLAALKGYDFGGEYDPHERYSGGVFFVPGHTIVGVGTAQALGITTEHDLFGGVVPHEFVATKTITHPLVDAKAWTPRGWSSDFTNRTQDAVLPGYSAFTAEDARRAGRLLLARGAVRVKPALAIGGRGQTVAANAADLDDAIASIDPRELELCGVVLEEHLLEVTTYSVGRVRVDDLIATYVGTQRLTADHQGVEVYGGSDLTVANGDFDVLLALDLPVEARLAVKKAQTYDSAAMACFAGLFASRRNYDIAAGNNEATGERHCGVLEQSWRVGGASGAEVGALEVFRAEPATRAVRAACFEEYGAGPAPRDAFVYFNDVDDEVGQILKYTIVEPYVDA